MAARVRAVVFDLWGTLMAERRELFPRRAELRYRGVAPLLRRHGLELSQDQFTRLQLQSNSIIGRMQDGGRDLSAEERARHVVYQFAPHLADRLSDDEVATFVEAYSGAIRETAPALLDGAGAALEACVAHGLRVGLISNTGVSSGRHLRQVFEAQGILGHFDVLLFSDELGIAKPSRAIFDRALDALAVPEREAVFVGDTPRLDVEPPRRYGWWVVQVGGRDDGDPAAHRRVGGVGEVVEALDGMGLLDAR
jgi:putative hydrolase of the HAD superfamily